MSRCSDRVTARTGLASPGRPQRTAAFGERLRDAGFRDEGDIACRWHKRDSGLILDASQPTPCCLASRTDRSGRPSRTPSRSSCRPFGRIRAVPPAFQGVSVGRSVWSDRRGTYGSYPLRCEGSRSESYSAHLCARAHRGVDPRGGSLLPAHPAMPCSVTLTIAPTAEPNAEGIGGVLDNRGQEAVEYGAGYRVERQLPSGQWRELTGVYTQAAAAFTLRPGQSRDIGFGFPRRSGDRPRPFLAEGPHRITLPVRCLTEGRERRVIAEFSISKG